MNVVVMDGSSTMRSLNDIRELRSVSGGEGAVTEGIDVGLCGYASYEAFAQFLENPWADAVAAIECFRALEHTDDVQILEKQVENSWEYLKDIVTYQDARDEVGDFERQLMDGPPGYQDDDSSSD